MILALNLKSILQGEKSSKEMPRVNHIARWYQRRDHLQFGASVPVAPVRMPARPGCELARVALDPHVTPVSRIVAVSLRLLRARKPRQRVVVSYADTSVGHYGGIYQAGGWIYTGGSPTHAYRIGGVPVHPRSLGQRYGKGGQSLP